MALSQSSLIVSGVCVGLCLISLLGLLSLRRMLFAAPLGVLAIVLIYIIVKTPSKELAAQITQTLQFLIIIFTAEAGVSTISFDKILQRMKGRTPMQAMTKAIKQHVANLTAIITASFTLSALLLSLGNMAKLKLEPAIMVATAIGILLATLVFLAINLRYPKGQDKDAA
ncbi:MAG: hypothetical protein RMJ15_00580 [Nitrososphaerota archaeon]|nr:hypothetical protein [Nitrososphaerota archaeon]